MWECITVQGLKKHIESSNKQGNTQKAKAKSYDRTVKRGGGGGGRKKWLACIQKKADTSNTELGGGLGLV